MQQYPQGLAIHVGAGWRGAARPSRPARPVAVLARPEVP